MHLLRNLFDFEKEQTSGEVIFFKLFELFLVFGTLKLAWQWALYTLRISDVVLPLGIARYVDISFMLGGPLPLINAAIVTGLVAAGFFRLFRSAYLIGFLFLHLQYAARYSLGEIPHSSNMLGMTLLGLALAMLVFRDDRHQRRFTFGFAYFFIGLGYSLAGVSKLVGTGWDWADGHHLWMWVYEKGIDSMAKTGALEFNVLQEVILSSQAIATVFLVIGLTTELFAFLLWWKKFRLPVMLGIVALHIGIYLVMNIFFTLAVYELVLLALPWPAWLDWLARRASWMDAVERASLRFA